MNLKHHFLIAMPTMDDPRFERAVIYLFQHDDLGAMGVVINKPLEELTLEKMLEDLKISSVSGDSVISLRQPVLDGGPLAKDRGFVLHTPYHRFEATVQITPEVMMTSSKDILESLGSESEPESILVLLGYARWEAGQLEQELLNNVWLTCEADTEVLFHTDFSDRWFEAACLLGVDIRHIAHHVGHA
ncbi:YqgE/AlgH family protein [Serratia microhaemolytica]|uniref:YqgE/AlgH family protein n=1 Tax=Serratia microhaemolytica TaxID=2675110 RepID=UPI000FDD0E37|nr:YqgE/AlgH family protein [Serratia microhaemolytica]